MKSTTLLCMLFLATITPFITGTPTGSLYYECNVYREIFAQCREKENRLVREIEDHQKGLKRHELVACSGLSSCASCSWYGSKIEICEGQHKANRKIATTLEALLKHKKLGHTATTSVRCRDCTLDIHTANDHCPTTTTTITRISEDSRPAPSYRRNYWPRRLGN